MKKLDRHIVTLKKKGEEDEFEEIKGDKAYLFALTWELTKDAWAFRGKENAEQRLQRDITNLFRRKR